MSGEVLVDGVFVVFADGVEGEEVGDVQEGEDGLPDALVVEDILQLDGVEVDGLAVVHGAALHGAAVPGYGFLPLSFYLPQQPLLLASCILQVDYAFLLLLDRLLRLF